MASLLPAPFVVTDMPPRRDHSKKDPSGANRLPLLAIPYAGLSLPVMTSAQAAAGLCSILWLVDGDDPSVQADRRAVGALWSGCRPGAHSAGRWADVVGPLRPDGILTFSDQRMVELAHLAEDLGLSFHRPEVARRLTDKVAQRDALRRAGLPVPATTALGSELDEGDLKESRRACGSRRCSSPCMGRTAEPPFVSMIPTSYLGAFRSLFDGHRPDMVLEEYLADTAPCLGQDFANYLSVESVVSNGTVEHFAVTGRFPLAPPFRETGFFIPADVTPTRELGSGSCVRRGARHGRRDRLPSHGDQVHAGRLPGH